ncbi:MAG TPA: molybdate ABC transporter substrate-binding protein [Solirubrobacterales bacterium]|nr:molybdate ABC transporter substrate-binding protein [Solirubrobacterales bacterium]
MRLPPAARLPAALALLVLAIPCVLLALAGCGGTESGTTLTVLAASSLSGALGEYAQGFHAATVRTSFAGSDQLAAQIRQGAPADVFASADTGYPQQLYREGLVERPRVFARNRLVAVTADGDIGSLAGLAKPGIKVVIGDPSVPVGEYTRVVLARLPAAERRRILANVRSEEPEVSSVLAKVSDGAADAGFVYATDAKAAAAETRTIRLPERLQPEVAYAAAVVRDSPHPAAARRYLAGLRSGAGAAALRRSGFLPP